MRNMTMTFRALALVMAVGLLTACDGDSTGPESVAGLYILQTFNGEELPVVSDNSGNITIAGSIELKSDGTYTRSSTFDVGSGPETQVQSGTFTVDGSTIQFSPGTIDGRLRMLPPGSISGNTLTLTIAGNPYVYAK